MGEQRNLSSLAKRVKRSDGLESKKAILQATLLIIVREGVREVKHRTVAELAGVTIASITYYFKDISLLLREAYIYYLEDYDNTMRQVRSICTECLRGRSTKSLKSRETKLEVIDAFSSEFAQVMSHEFYKSYQFIFLDRVIRNELLRKEEFVEAFAHQDQMDLDTAIHFLARLGAPCPESDAYLLLSILGLLGEKVLNEKDAQSQIEMSSRLISYTLKKILHLN